VKTALATDEPDEPERKAALTAVASTLSSAASYTYPATGGNVGAGLDVRPAPPTTTATFPQRVIGPWQCPDCKTWMAPTVTEHRCH